MATVMDDQNAVAGRWRLAAAAVLIAAAALFLVRLGDAGTVSEEVRWATVAREMRESDDYLRPTFNGQLYYDKPVGSYWLVVAASHLIGTVDETAARLPAAVAGWVGVLLVMALGRRVYGWPAGVLAGAVLASSLGFAQYSRRATADIETVTGVLAAVCIYERCRDRRGNVWVVGLWLVMTATSLTKGLLGFALPVAVFAAHGTLTGLAAGPTPRAKLAGVIAGNRWLFNGWTLLAVPLAGAVYFAPFLLSVQQTGAADGLQMVWRENVRRFVAPHNHLGPPYLYVYVVFLLAAPWSAFLPASLLPNRAVDESGDRLVRTYFWAVFVLFTLSASRRSYYLLPVLPAVALLVGRVLTLPAEQLHPAARRLRTAGWLAGVVAVVAAGVVLVPREWLSLPIAYDQLPDLPMRAGFAVGWVAALAAVGWAARRPTVRPAVGAVIAFAALGYGFGVVMPTADGFRTRRQFAAEVRGLTVADPDRLALFRARDAVFDLGRPVPDYADPADVTAALAAGRVRWVLVPRRHLVPGRWPTRVVAEEAVQPWEAAGRVGDKLLLLEAYP